jgi:hypothetical protein
VVSNDRFAAVIPARSVVVVGRLLPNWHPEPPFLNRVTDSAGTPSPLDRTANSERTIGQQSAKSGHCPPYTFFVEAVIRCLL